MKNKRLLEDYTNHALITNRKPRPWRRGRSSLHDVVNTKEKAERFMMLLEWEAQKHRKKDLES